GDRHLAEGSGCGNRFMDQQRYKFWAVLCAGVVIMLAGLVSAWSARRTRNPWLMAQAVLNVGMGVFTVVRTLSSQTLGGWTLGVWFLWMLGLGYTSYRTNDRDRF